MVDRLKSEVFKYMNKIRTGMGRMAEKVHVNRVHGDECDEKLYGEEVMWVRQMSERIWECARTGVCKICEV